MYTYIHVYTHTYISVCVCNTCVYVCVCANSLVHPDVNAKILFIQGSLYMYIFVS